MLTLPPKEAVVDAVRDNGKLLAAAGIAGVGGWMMYRYWTYGVSIFEPVYTKDGVCAKKEDKVVLFGKVEGQNRGPSPMDPPRQTVDPYYWMRDDKRSARAVITHLNRENAYFEAQTKGLSKLKKEIYNEFVSHIKETDENVPHPHGPFFYYTRTVKGLSYKIHCRKRSVGGHPAGAEQIILDVNQLAKGRKHCDVQMVEPSPEHTVMAFTVDYTGYETYDVFFKDMATGKLLSESLKETAGEIVWGPDRKTIFYTTLDPEHRPNKVWRHTMGTPQSSDALLLTEDDELFWLDLDKTCSGRFLVVRTSSPTRSECHVLDLEGPKGAAGELAVVQPREDDHRYKVEHWGQYLYIITNLGGCSNSKLMRTPIGKMGKANWEQVLPYESTTKLDYLVVFKSYIVVNGRYNGLKMCRVLDMGTGSAPPKVHDLVFPEDCYDMYADHNRVFDTVLFRFGYSSLISPNSVLEYNMATRQRTLLKETDVPLYDRTLYTCKRLFATAKDGTKVPISLVYRKDSSYGAGKGPSPCMLYGYGSYGMCIDPCFSPKTISFLDRGMVYAIAHIRGGGRWVATGMRSTASTSRNATHSQTFATALNFSSGGGSRPRIGLPSRAGALGGCLWAPLSTCALTSSGRVLRACPSLT